MTSGAPVETPVVSIVTATRNRADLLERTLGAFAAQSFPAFEVIVIDDGSTAETWAAYDRIWASLDRRFILEKPPMPGQPGTGSSAARNRGVRRARGEFIAFCDDDDRWLLADHLDLAVRTMRATGADLYLVNMCGEDAGRVTIPDWFPDSPRLTAGPLVNQQPPVHDLSLPDLLSVLRHHVPHPDGWVVRRSLIESVGGFWERIDYGEDLELLFRIVARAHRILYRPATVVGFNVTPRDSLYSRTSTLEKSVQAVAAAMHVCGLVDEPRVRRGARSIAAWYYRRLARDLIAERRASAAIGMAWQAVCTFPTPGAIRDLATSIVRAWARS